jgi:hypothetical protein
MNWRLVLQLSMFGVAMGLGVVFFLSPGISTALWVIFIALSAWAIAKRCARLRFLNGLMAGLICRLAATAAWILFFHSYVVRHPDQMALLQELTPRMSPRHLIELVSPVWGLGLGVVIGLAALLIGVFLKPQAPQMGAAA